MSEPFKAKCMMCNSSCGYEDWHILYRSGVILCPDCKGHPYAISTHNRLMEEMRVDPINKALGLYQD